MTSYVLDTNHVSAIFQKHKPLIEKISVATGSDFGIALPSVGELWFMVFNSARIRTNAADMEAVLAGFRQWGFTPAAAKEFGGIKAELRRAGRMIPDVDIQIAAVARTEHLIVLTADKHFDAIPGLTVENWLL